MARPKHKPTEKDRLLVKVLAGVMAEQAIANAMQICRNTLRKNYKQELKEGKDFFLAQAITALMNNIKKGKEASIFFYLKTQHGWKEKTELQHTGRDGGPIEMVDRAKEETPEQWLKRVRP